MTFINGTQFINTAGDAVHGHGGSMIKVGGYYYWFGENTYPNGPFASIPVYRSTDLHTWEFRNSALSLTSAPELRNAGVWRPRVIYNARTQQYVLFVRKENYPSPMTENKAASIQALKFGARMYFPSKVTTVDTSGERLGISLFGGIEILARAVIIATGAHYRSLPIARWGEFENAGIYYACTELEVRSCAGREVAVVGGANSAGQAALFLSSRGCTVDLVVRGEDIGARMSSYLVNRIVSDPMISVRASTEITALEGDTSLESVRMTNSVTGEEAVKPCRGLFCFIGADPASGWLYGDCSVDGNGFIRTDAHIPTEDLGQHWQNLGRGPLPFETSIPGVFAAGDVRHGSIKRAAAAVGEGASAVSSVHQVVGVRL
ncbi:MULTISPECIES: FAD-dependent oxidoreductase [Streptomyces]|uniref:FAD-dependent oxidoreductase n=1 Tax=Streptomyces lonegramiae TaxID=3075524 RepID=A0ABU2XCX5_9ACTN|nr:FAD-dependent oxidoreductase [Streptomyces sp. DSM 41529]MDT0543756.1 FAD-dependent oxidoreductase [Streptomyces sp. DSM 41529]